MISRDEANRKATLDRASGVEGANPIQGARGLGPARPLITPEQDVFGQVAQTYSENLSGANGPKAQFRAIEEIIDNKLRETLSKFTITGPGGQAVSGKWPYFTTNDYRVADTSDPLELEADEVAYIPPLKVLPLTEDEGATYTITLQQSVMTNQWEAVDTTPTLANGSLDTPLSVPSGTHTLYGRLVVTPTSTLRGSTYVLSGVTTDTEWDFDYHSTADARFPTINPSTGDSTQTGIFYRALAQTTADGETLEVVQYRFGPWTTAFCPGSASIDVRTAPFGMVTVNVTTA